MLGTRVEDHQFRFEAIGGSTTKWREHKVEAKSNFAFLAICEETIITVMKTIITVARQRRELAIFG